jgi:predicted Rossmann fold flavoprotein
VQRHRIAWHEKHKGQLFCDDSAEDIITMLQRECDAGNVTRWQPCGVHAVRHGVAGFELDTDRGTVRSAQLVIATGGLSIPKIGATDFGYRLARQFGHTIQETRPALVPLTFDPVTWAPFAALSGLSLEVRVETGSGKAKGAFLEDLLFTHRGLSGPAILQISSFWHAGTPLRLNLAPDRDLAAELLQAKRDSRRILGNELAELIPRRLAEAWLAPTPELAAKPLPDQRDRDLTLLAERLNRWELKPQGSEGYRKAEVTAGGVDTRELSSQTLQSQRVDGLFFIGEVVDVTGWLGGYNFQWAWASAAACARALSPLRN